MIRMLKCFVWLLSLWAVPLQPRLKFPQTILWQLTRNALRYQSLSSDMLLQELSLSVISYFVLQDLVSGELFLLRSIYFCAIEAGTNPVEGALWITKWEETETLTYVKICMVTLQFHFLLWYSVHNFSCPIILMFKVNSVVTPMMPWMDSYLFHV